MDNELHALENQSPDRVMKLSEGAKQIGLSTQSLIKYYIPAGKLTVIRYNPKGWYHVTQSEVDRFKKEELAR